MFDFVWRTPTYQEWLSLGERRGMPTGEEGAAPPKVRL